MGSGTGASEGPGAGRGGGRRAGPAWGIAGAGAGAGEYPRGSRQALRRPRGTRRRRRPRRPETPPPRRGSRRGAPGLAVGTSRPGRPPTATAAGSRAPVGASSAGRRWGRGTAGGCRPCSATRTTCSTTGSAAGPRGASGGARRVGPRLGGASAPRATHTLGVPEPPAAPGVSGRRAGAGSGPAASATRGKVGG